MKKRLFQVAAFILCMVMLCNITAYATEMRASSQLSSCMATLSKKSTGELNLLFTAIGVGRSIAIGAESIEFQRSSNGTSWTTENTYTVEDLPELQDSDTSSHSLLVEYTPQYKNMTYRAIVVIYAENTEGVTTRTLTTNTV